MTDISSRVPKKNSKLKARENKDSDLDSALIVHRYYGLECSEVGHENHADLVVVCVMNS